MAAQLVHKLPPPSNTNCVVMFFNYDGYIDVVETTYIREFCSSISLVHQAGSYKDVVHRGAQEAIWWLLESGNGVRSQLEAVRERSFRRTLSSYGLGLVRKDVYLKQMKKKPKPEKKSVFISDDDDDDDEEEEEEEEKEDEDEDEEQDEEDEEVFIARQKRSHRKARPTKKIIELSTSSDEDIPEPSRKAIAGIPSKSCKASRKSLQPDFIVVEDDNNDAGANYLDHDIDDMLDYSNARLADLNLDEYLLRPSKHPRPIAHNVTPVPR